MSPPFAGAHALPATLDGDTLRTGLAASAEWFDLHTEAINALNVFPVPDGDTGLNMSLTLRSAVDQVALTASRSLPDVAAAMARGALMGARGNSGVILATLLRGVARAFEGHELADARVFAAALTEGADAAYGAVASPVEGTILTVARRAGAAASSAARNSKDLIRTLDEAHAAARVAVAETPDLLPILRQASVVDAGGEGFRVFLEGLLMHLRGDEMEAGSAPIDMRADLSSLHDHPDDFYGYCTEVLLRGEQLDVESVRSRLCELGGSVLVVGDAELLKAHVHTLRPGAVLDLATDMGEILKVKIDNMQLQHEAFATSTARVAPLATDVQLPQAAGTAVVAVALGDGFCSLFRSFGAVVVPCGRTMNASVEEIATAINGAPRQDVIVLPNDHNVALAALRAAELASEHTVEVVRTTSMPQGIAAALALNPDATAPANVPGLTAAASRCRTIEMVRAVRDAQIGTLSVGTGSPLGFLDGLAVATGPSFPDLLASVLDHLPADMYEIATIYVGSAADPNTAERLVEVLTSRAQEVEVVNGGQPHFDYIISLE